MIMRKTDRFYLCVEGNRKVVRCRVKGAEPAMVRLTNRQFLQLCDTEMSDGEFDATVVLEIGCGLHGITGKERVSDVEAHKIRAEDTPA